MQTNSIEHITQAFNAGEQKTFNVSGTYFELIDCPNNVNVVLTDLNGVQKAILKEAQESFFLKSVDFGVIQITSATAQTVRFAYGSGETGTRRTTGSMSIVGTPGVSITGGVVDDFLVKASNKKNYSHFIANTQGINSNLYYVIKNTTTKQLRINSILFDSTLFATGVVGQNKKEVYLGLFNGIAGSFINNAYNNFGEFLPVGSNVLSGPYIQNEYQLKRINSQSNFEFIKESKIYLMPGWAIGLNIYNGNTDSMNVFVNFNFDVID